MEQISAETLRDAIVEGAQEKKANDIAVIDFSGIDNAVARYFVICDADSTTHVSAIAGSIEEFAKKTTGTNVWRREGYENSEWILLDYVDVVAHVFLRHTRAYYSIEDLWADAKQHRVQS
jgi:ribosome-associated protein